LLTGAGLMLLAMGAIGLLLPVWPTTPFVLAAAGCLAATPRLRARVMRLPFVSEYLQNYRDRRGVSRRTLRISLAFLWGMLGLSMALARNGWLTVLLLLVGAAVTAHLLWVARPRG
jgi:hypothetical protein